jgi:hypothetical protein
MREAEIDQLKKDMDDMAAKAKDYTHFDPIEDVRRDIEKSVGELPSLDQPAATTPNAEATDAQTAALPQPSGDATTTAVEPAPPPEPAAAPEPAIAHGKPDAGRAPA